MPGHDHGLWFHACPGFRLHGHTWTMPRLPGTYIEAFPGLISNFTISPSTSPLPEHSKPQQCLLPVFIIPRDASQVPKLWALHDITLERLWFCRGTCKTPEEVCCSPFRDTGAMPHSLFLKCCLNLALFSTLFHNHLDKNESIKDYKKSYSFTLKIIHITWQLELAECIEELHMTCSKPHATYISNYSVYTGWITLSFLLYISKTENKNKLLFFDLRHLDANTQLSWLVS